MDDLKNFQEVFNFIEERGSELVEFNSFLDTKNYGDYYSGGIFEVLDDKVGFECSHYQYHETAFKYFTYNQLLDEEYYTDLKNKVTEKKNAELAEKQEQIRVEAEVTKQKELELYKQLKEKYENQ